MPERLNLDDNDLFLRYKDKSIFSKKETITECFNYFDKNKLVNFMIFLIGSSNQKLIQNMLYFLID